MKKCSKCGEEKKSSEFFPRPGSAGAVRGVCESCRKKTRREWYLKNCEKMSEAGKERYKKNSFMIRLRTKLWYLANFDKIKEQARAKYLLDPKKYYEKTNKWRKANPDKYHTYQRNSRIKTTRKCWELILREYGGKCACCGEFNPKFLTVDHIKGGGGKHRKEVAGGRLYPWIVRNNFPKEDFQLLCWNCNCGRYHNSGTCPHKEK